MTIDTIRNIGVIGAGNMGHQIALVAALAGYHTSLTDVSGDDLARAEAHADTYLAERVAKGRLSEADGTAARGRLRFAATLADCVQDADFVIEAAVEKLEVKRRLFADLDRLAPPHAILATNSSAIVSSAIASSTGRPDKVLNMHFFNPALVMKLVEVVQGPHVSDETAQTTIALARKLGKVPVHLHKEVDGFLLNRILDAVFREAGWLLEMGVASIEDIDLACVHGAGHPMGPFRLLDLIGLDLAHIMAMERFSKSGDAGELPMPQLAARVAAGHLGQKTGQGWYDYRGTDRAGAAA